MTLAGPDQHAEAEARLRAEIAGCTRLLNMEGLMGYSGHVSARLPGDRLLIQDFDQSRAALAPGDLLVCDLNGRLVAGATNLRPVAEVHIHSEIYKARPDVNAVAHFHHDLTTTFTLVEGLSLVPVKNHAVRWRSGIPVHADPSHVDTPELGRGLAATLGPHHALLIRAHGQVVVAEDVRSLFVDCIHLVENAVSLYQAAALGRVLPLTEREMDDFSRSFKRDKHVAKLWTYYVGRGREAGLLPEAWDRHL
ncbi:MAG TPA: class II aldolase/adducin family protein [Beijerinckiaceae bacterium]|nr:class II aldolase/adducin family protein [Beijerinckiaceae bacterium]